MIKDILTISGESGLFRKVSEVKNSLVVESLVDGKRRPAYSTSRVIYLDDVSIYTNNGDIKLSEIFVILHEKGSEVDPKAKPEVLKSYFEEVLPEYDKDRVYASDIKKLLSWFNLLKNKGIINDETIADYKSEKLKTSQAEPA